MDNNQLPLDSPVSFQKTMFPFTSFAVVVGDLGKQCTVNVWQMDVYIFSFFHCFYLENKSVSGYLGLSEWTEKTFVPSIFSICNFNRKKAFILSNATLLRKAESNKLNTFSSFETN